MDNSSLPASSPTLPGSDSSALPPAAPAPAAPPAPPATPPVAPAAPQGTFAEGGQATNKSGWSSVFDGVNLTDVCMIALGVVATGLVIYYYRKKIMHMQNDNAALVKKVEAIETEQQKFSAFVQGEQQPQQAINSHNSVANNFIL